MRSIDLPRSLLDRSAGQPSEPTGETGSRARPWVPDGRARPPAELLDNLRLRLSQLADNHPSAPRSRHPRADWGAPRDWGPPRGWPASGDGDGPGDWGAPRDSDGPGDWDGPGDRGVPEDRRWRPEQDASAGEGEAAERDIGSPADQPADTDAEAGGFGGLADAIRAASRLSDAFPASVDGGWLGEMSLFASGGQAEPYRPWFMSGEPLTPWWAADSGD